jgi:hypothetical protein
MENEFNFTIYSERWGHEDSYRIKRTLNGWHISFLSTSPAESGETDKAGRPILYNLLEHDGIAYPDSLSKYLEWLWGYVNNNEISDEEIQNALDKLAKWVTLCERNKPSWFSDGL